MSATTTRLRIRNLARMSLACSCGDTARGYISPASVVPEFCAAFLAVHTGPGHRVTGEGFLPSTGVQHVPPTLRAICTACRIGGDRVLATHASRFGDGHSFCDEHARPGDMPLGEVSTADAVDAVRERVWPGLDTPQGLMSDE